MLASSLDGPSADTAAVTEPAAPATATAAAAAFAPSRRIPPPLLPPLPPPPPEAFWEQTAPCGRPHCLHGPKLPPPPAQQQQQQHPRVLRLFWAPIVRRAAVSAAADAAAAAVCVPALGAPRPVSKASHPSTWAGAAAARATAAAFHAALGGAVGCERWEVDWAVDGEEPDEEEGEGGQGRGRRWWRPRGGGGGRLRARVARAVARMRAAGGGCGGCDGRCVKSETKGRGAAAATDAGDGEGGEDEGDCVCGCWCCCCAECALGTIEAVDGWNSAVRRVEAELLGRRRRWNAMSACGGMGGGSGVVVGVDEEAGAQSVATEVWAAWRARAWWSGDAGRERMALVERRCGRALADAAAAAAAGGGGGGINRNGDCGGDDRGGSGPFGEADENPPLLPEPRLRSLCPKVEAYVTGRTCATLDEVVASAVLCERLARVGAESALPFFELEVETAVSESKKRTKMARSTGTSSRSPSSPAGGDSAVQSAEPPLASWVDAAVRVVSRRLFDQQALDIFQTLTVFESASNGRDSDGATLQDVVGLILS
ncbi:hypothetical protein DFJ73DRAFT_960394 [Zopfochytrium polystomum]|nr:hypothetical protein DFJ73DRAFT_960394 [Zopfochytrium polystomum]